MRAVRRVLLLVVVGLLVGGVAFTLSARPDLDAARDAADESWDALAPDLDARYALLDGLTTAVAERSTRARPITAELDDALERWRRVGEREGSTRAAVRVANELEGLARRLTTLVEASPLLADDETVAPAATAWRDVPPPEGLTAYQEAATAYEQERSGTLRSVAAAVLRHEPVPALDLASGAPSA
jgi:hypothetical protein